MFLIKSGPSTQVSYSQEKFISSSFLTPIHVVKDNYHSILIDKVAESALCYWSYRILF